MSGRASGDHMVRPLLKTIPAEVLWLGALHRLFNTPRTDYKTQYLIGIFHIATSIHCLASNTFILSHWVGEDSIKLS